MKVYIYRMISDRGVAPNYNGKYATLAQCKPRIRKSASVGDYVIGMCASTELRIEDDEYLKKNPKDIVIWIGQVIDKMRFEQYNKLCITDKRMKIKIPTKRRIGDCQIINPTKFRAFHHDAVDLRTDLSGEYVLLFKRFKHFRKKDSFSLYLPQHIFDATKLAIGHHVIHEPSKDLIDFIEKNI